MRPFNPDRKQNTTRERKVLVFSRYYYFLSPQLFMNAFQPIETSFVKTSENGWNITPKGSPRSPRRRELSPHKSSLSPKSSHGSPKCKWSSYAVESSAEHFYRGLSLKSENWAARLSSTVLLRYINTNSVTLAVLVSVRDIKMPQHGFAKGPLLSTSQIHHESVSKWWCHLKYDHNINTIVRQIKLENIMSNKVLLTDADIRYLFQTIGLPKFCARPLIDKLNGVVEEYIDYAQKTEIEEYTKTLSSELFRKFWEENLKYFDNVRRVFNLIRHPSRDYIIPNDFEPIFKGKTAITWTNIDLVFVYRNSEYTSWPCSTKKCSWISKSLQ